MYPPNKKRSARRSFLLAPANKPEYLAKQAASKADSVTICMEDAILPDAKDEARLIAAQAMRTLDYGGKEIFIRMNGLDTDFWLEDLEVFCRLAPPDGFNIAKVQGPEDIRVVSRVLDTLEKRFGIAPGSIMISCMIETAQAMRDVDQIATASPRMANLHFGAVDYSHSINSIRTPGQMEEMYAMSRIVTAARSAGLEPIGVMYINIHDAEGLRRSCEVFKQFGFTGRSTPTPRQIDIINEAFSPSEAEVAKARKILDGLLVATKEKNRGVYLIDGEMTDGPMIKASIRTLERAGLTHAAFDIKV